MGFGRRLGRWRARFAAASRIVPWRPPVPAQVPSRPPLRWIRADSSPVAPSHSRLPHFLQPSTAWQHLHRLSRILETPSRIVPTASSIAA